jgi:hypothetical protein
MNARANSALQSVTASLTKPTVVVAMAFVVSRWFYYHLGVSFDGTILYYAEQFLDVNLLRGRLIESVFYLHCQPPLFNFFLGCVLKAFPGHLDIAFHLIYLGFGLITALSLVSLMIRLGVPGVLSTVLTVVFMANPVTILYENWLFYVYPVVSVLSVSALALHKWVSVRKFRYGLIFFTCWAALVLTWSLFQLLWVVPVCLITVLYGRIRWQSVVAAAAVPLIVIVGWQFKNWHYFGVFRTSSWMGMNMSRNTFGLLSPEETEALVKQSKLSELALIPIFSQYEAYRPYLPEPPGTDVPALNQEVKRPPSVGANYNYVGYLEVSEKCLDDAICVIKSKPYEFLQTIRDAFLLYLVPASDYVFVEANRNRIPFPVGVYNAIFYGSLKKGEIGLLIVYGLALSIGYGAYLAVSWIRRRPDDPAYAATMVFVWLTIICVTLVVSLFERIENNRMRFITEPYVMIILGIIVDGIRRRCLDYRGGASWNRSDD